MSFNQSQQSNVNSNVNNSNIILQTLKRRTNKQIIPLDERVTLERVYGLTITSNTRIAQSIDGTIAYLAGCVIVLYNPTRQNENDYIISSARKTLTTLAFSLDGKTLATGESGHDPRVRVWDVREKIQIAEFAGHKFSIECVYFSPNVNSNLLVSIGSQHDMVVNVWNLKSKFKAASNKISCKVKGTSFSRDGSYFVTVGNRHVKFWYLTTSSLMETVPLKGRAAILGEYKNYYFCDVVCGSDDCSHLTFALTTNGIVCEFNENRYLSNAIDLRTENAYCIYADNFCLFVGCSNGNIHIFKQKNLEFITCLPRPHHLGVDVAQGRDTSHVIENLNNPDLKYPDCVALCYNKFNSILTAVYNDHSIYTWDITDLSKVKKLQSHLFHCSSVSALDIYTNNSNNILPIDSFVTCSNDNTLRIWSSCSSSLNNLNTSKLKSNIYSKELLKIIYIDNDLSGLCDIDTSLTNNSSENETVTTSNNSSNNVTSLPSGSINNNIDLGNGNAPKLGARCLQINPYGTHLATGDRNGNIRVFDLETLESIGTIEAHDGEILCLQYSPIESGRLLLASSSRDRLIHIFDAATSYTPIQTIDDHSSSIAALRFCFNQIDKQLFLISCGNDKSIMFRTMSEPNQFTRTSYAVEKQTFHDLIIDQTNSLINTISQDRMIRTYSIKDGKRLRQLRGSLNEDGHLLKMDMDRTGQFVAASCTDKCVYIWDLNTSECVAYIYGHSEVVSDLKFSSDNQYLITVSGDGCIFVWKLNNLITPRKLSIQKPVQKFDTLFDSDENLLPAWAKNKLNNLQTVIEPPVRRSRAVWGPPTIDTSFAVMSDSELSSVKDDDFSFPSPCVDEEKLELNSINLRRQSLSAKYLMKTQQVTEVVLEPVQENIPKKKLSTTPMRRSPSASSLSNDSRSSINSKIKSSPNNETLDENNLKKALSMVQLNKNQVKKTTLLPPKTMRQIKQRSAERQVSTNLIPPRHTVTFIEQNKHLRKLSNSIQNISNSSGLSLLQSKSPQLSPKKTNDDKDQMLSSTSSSEETNLRESSLSSSSSSSCSIYEQTMQECQSNKLLTTVKSPQIMNRSSEFCTKSSCLSNQSFTGFKKPVTFASLAASSNSSSLNILINSNQCSTQSSPNSGNKTLTSEKIESILYEFKQNMMILDCIYNQVSNNGEDFKKLQQTANLIQTSTCNSNQIASTQTLQIIQTFNTSIYSIVKQFKAILNNQNITTTTSTSTSSNPTSTSTLVETINNDTDLEELI